MSEERHKSSSILLRKRGKNIKVELFPAVQWKRIFRYGKGVFNPMPTINPGWWENKFRVRINGAWHCIGESKYSFLDVKQIKELVSSKLNLLIK